MLEMSMLIKQLVNGENWSLKKVLQIITLLLHLTRLIEISKQAQFSFLCW